MKKEQNKDEVKENLTVKEKTSEVKNNSKKKNDSKSNKKVVTKNKGK